MTRTGISAAIAAAALIFILKTNPAYAEEPWGILELGGAGEGSSTETPAFGPSVGIEVEPIEHWLEIEAGLSALSHHGGTELEMDLLFKKPFILSDTVEFMIGIGPAWTHGLKGRETGDSIGMETAGDFMFWPWDGRRIGWYAEPSYGYEFAHGHQQTLGISVGILVPLP